MKKKEFCCCFCLITYGGKISQIEINRQTSLTKPQVLTCEVRRLVVLVSKGFYLLKAFYFIQYHLGTYIYITYFSLLCMITLHALSIVIAKSLKNNLLLL